MASGIVPRGVCRFLTNTSKQSTSQPLNSALTLVFSCRRNWACFPANRATLCNSVTTPVMSMNGSLEPNEDNFPLQSTSLTNSAIRDGLPRRPKTFDARKDEDSEAPSRKSKFLGGLAFLAGLSVGGLASVASTTSKTLARIPHASVTLNLGPSRLTPYLAAFYDPYAFAPPPFPYLFAPYPLPDPSKLQTGAGSQGALRPSTDGQATPQVVALYDDKRPVDVVDGEEEFLENSKNAAGDKSSDRKEEPTNERMESRTEVDRDTGGKHTTIGAYALTCTTSKESAKKSTSTSGPLKDERRDDLQDETDGSGASFNSRQVVNPTHANATTNTTIPPTNGTNHTGYPPFLGYYGGSPQDISQVDLTTHADGFGYHDFDRVNYNPGYERPAGFYPDERYNYYPSSPTGPFFPPGSYLQEQPSPDYVNGDDNKLLYPPDNPSYVSGFRPSVI